jgi:hypothetical protein
MQGKILDYNTEFKSGLIRGEDSSKYRFSIDDCKSAITPKANAEVDFEPSGDKAVEIYVMTKDALDDVKDVASSAINTTAHVAKVGVEKTKLIMPIVKAFVAIAAVGLAIMYIINVYLPEQQENEFNEKRKSLFNEGKQLIESGDYNNAILKLQAAKDMGTNYKTYRQCVNEEGYNCSELEQYDFKIAHAYIGLKNPDKALELLSDPWKASAPNPKAISIFEQAGAFPTCQTVQGCNIAENKGYFCILASKAYQLKGDKLSAQSYAQLACDYGDCSLVEK